MSETVQKVTAAVTGTNHVVPCLINGKEVDIAETFDVVNPATGKAVHKCHSITSKEADDAVAAAAAALPSWSATTPKYRRDIFFKAAEILDQRKEELAKYVAEETGQAGGWGDFNIANARDFLFDIGGRIAAAVEGRIPTTQDAKVGALLLKEPYGVVLAISPWNAPYILGMRAIANPIAAGNTVIFKGSELSPRCLWALCDIFAQAGLPAGVLNYVVAAPSNAASVTSALISHPEVKKINFTGSTPVGRILAKMAGEHLKPILLELGGKAPAIVWEDADLDLAADQAALGAFLNSGQVCMSTERVIVHKAVRATFEEKLAASVEKFFSSAGEAPVLIREAGAAKTRALAHDAKAKGAKVVGADVEGTENTGKARMRPLILSGVTPDMDIYRTESFGPTVSVFEVDTEEAALRLANDTEYGLSSAVFTRDLQTGLRLARGIETGAVHINAMTVHDEAALPHGGAKASGYGRFNSSLGLEEWLRTKTVTFPM